MRHIGLHIESAIPTEAIDSLRHLLHFASDCPGNRSAHHELGHGVICAAPTASPPVTPGLSPVGRSRTR